jgi:cache domain-containing protein
MVERAQKERLGRRICQVGAIMFVLLLANGLSEMWFSYQEHKASLIRIQSEQADAAAAKIGQFINEIVSQLGWTTQLPWSVGTMEQRRFDALRLMRQMPAITDFRQLDSTGLEQVRQSRLAIVYDGPIDFSQAPEFTVAMKKNVYYGPMYFRRESEPYMTLAVAGTPRDAGVSVVEVNLKLIWDVVSQIKVGDKGDAYLVDAQGRLIAHPDISLVLRNTDVSKLAQVQAARRTSEETPADQEVQIAEDLQGREVLTAYAPVSPLGWIVFVELPMVEAYGPVYAAIERLFVLLLVVMLGFFGIAWFSRRSRRWAPRKTLGPSEAIE